MRRETAQALPFRASRPAPGDPVGWTLMPQPAASLGARLPTLPYPTGLMPPPASGLAWGRSSRPRANEQRADALFQRLHLEDHGPQPVGAAGDGASALPDPGTARPEPQRNHCSVDAAEAAQAQSQKPSGYSGNASTTDSCPSSNAPHPPKSARVSPRFSSTWPSWRVLLMALIPHVEAMHPPLAKACRPLRLRMALWVARVKARPAPSRHPRIG